MRTLLTITAAFTFIALAPVSGVLAVILTSAQLSVAVITKLRGY